MREILFRGQTRRKGEKVRIGDGKPLESNWVYGGIFPQNNGGDFAIIYSQEPIEKHTVYADTVSQYIGNDDKNLVKIFENDIVKYFDEVIGKCKFFVVEYHDCGFDFKYKTELGFQYLGITNTMANRCEVVGNIYDNPELLEMK